MTGPSDTVSKRFVLDRPLLEVRVQKWLSGHAITSQSEKNEPQLVTQTESLRETLVRVTSSSSPYTPQRYTLSTLQYHKQSGLSHIWGPRLSIISFDLSI